MFGFTARTANQLRVVASFGLSSGLRLYPRRSFSPFYEERADLPAEWRGGAEVRGRGRAGDGARA